MIVRLVFFYLLSSVDHLPFAAFIHSHSTQLTFHKLGRNAFHKQAAAAVAAACLNHSPLISSPAYAVQKLR